MRDAFYLPAGESFVSTDLTRGPWDPQAQHGGPPAALLGSELERRHPRSDVVVARVTFEILGPVPLQPLTVITRVRRPGRSVELLEGVLSAGERDVLRAAMWRIRTSDTAAVAVPVEPPAPVPGPEDARPLEFFPTGYDEGYHTGIDSRFVRGAFLESGPALTWMRMRAPLVAGTATPALARVLIAADSGNGVSGELDYQHWLFVNPELTVHLFRLPVGEWVCLDARTTIGGFGVGMAETVLRDEQGPIGRGAQSLYVTPRSQPSATSTAVAAEPMGRTGD